MIKNKLGYLIEQGKKLYQVIVPGQNAKEIRANLNQKTALGFEYEDMTKTPGWADPESGLEAYLDRIEENARFQLLETGASPPEIPEITEQRVIKRIKDRVALIIVQGQKAGEQLVNIKEETEE